jgi:hypothetical protein
MAQYYRVSPNFWKGRRSWSDREKLLAQYLLSCPHRNLEGLYWLPLAYVEADLAWAPKVVRSCLQTISTDGFAAYDDDAEVLFLCKALSFQAPSSAKQLQGAISNLERVPKTALWDRFLKACDEWAPELAEKIRNSSQSHPNLIPVRSETHSDIARTRISNSNSSSNSNPPSPPNGGRQRERDRFEQELTDWVTLEFPELNTKAALGYTRSALAEGRTDRESVREFVLRWSGSEVVA